ncbi:DUF6438 domain-containing protein [Methylocucumis oryzae]|nr:DUF6438 domain-containing protein [Methylocucumis oryzae]
MSLSPSLYAGLLDPPVISYSVIDCEKSYLVQVFKDGRVEYRGGEGVTIQGKHSSRISQDTVAALMKSFSGTKT